MFFSTLQRLGKRELILVLFVRLFDLRLFGFVCFFFLLVSGKGCGLSLCHSLDFSLTFFCICGTPWTFLVPFFQSIVGFLLTVSRRFLCCRLSLLMRRWFPNWRLSFHNLFLISPFGASEILSHFQGNFTYILMSSSVHGQLLKLSITYDFLGIL